MTWGNAHQYLKKVYLTTKNDSYREALSVALSPGSRWRRCGPDVKPVKMQASQLEKSSYTGRLKALLMYLEICTTAPIVAAQLHP